MSRCSYDERRKAMELENVPGCGEECCHEERIAAVERELP